MFKSIEIGSPLSKVSVGLDGDILIVPSIISSESYVYQYHQCTQTYSLIDTLESGTYDEWTAMNSKYLLQGNFNGTIKISEYSYVYNATCEAIENAASTTVRQKSSSDDFEDDSKKMLTTDSKNQDYSGNTMSTGIIFLIVLGSVIVFAIIVTLSTFYFIFSSMDVEKRTKE